jgi:hypothetical protein
MDDDLDLWQRPAMLGVELQRCIKRSRIRARTTSG